MGVEIKKGQFLTGRHKLSADTGITEQTLRTCLNRLKSTNEITIASTNRFSIITLCNYSDYQSNEDNSNQQANQQANQQSTSNQPATNQQLTTYKNIKEHKNKKKESFDLFWKAYPRKENKTGAFKSWTKILFENGLYEELIAALEKQKNTTKWKSEPQFIPHPATWLNGRRWEDEIIPQEAEDERFNFQKGD